MTHAAYDPSPPVRHPLRVELFALAHSDAGEPLVHLPSLSIGLAAAMLTSLIMPTERVRIVADAAIVVNRSMSGDPVADWAVRHLDGMRGGLSVRAAVRELAVHAYDKVAAGLIAGGLVERAPRRRRLSRIERYPLTDPNLVYRVRGRLRYVTAGHEEPDPQTDALGGLIRALGLESELYLDSTRADLRGLLRQMLARVDRSYPGIRAVIDKAENLIGDTAVSVYR